LINGIMIIRKEQGYTSADVVAKLRGICRQKKIGHTGTLDPNATGVLPVCLGNATRVCEMLTDCHKIYEASLRLGTTTDTQDVWGQIISDTGENWKKLQEEDVRQTVMSFQGDYEQLPPMYSALKINGRRLYELAREGKEVERKTRKIMIYDIEILSINLPDIQIRVECSKGTYIRTLCHDIGSQLGCGAMMTKLERTAASGFSLQEAYTLSEVQKLCDEGHLQDIVRDVETCFLNYPVMHVRSEEKKRLYNGNVLEWSHFKDRMEGDIFRIYDSEDRFFAVYRTDAEKECLKPWKIFPDME